MTRRWSLRNSLAVAAGIVAVAAFCALIEYIGWDKQCRSNDALLNWQVPAGLQGWQNAFIPRGRQNHIHLPASNETLFWSVRSPYYESTLYRISAEEPEPQPLVSSFMRRKPFFVQAGDNNNNNNNRVCFEVGQQKKSEDKIGCYLANSGAVQFIPPDVVRWQIDPIFYKNQIWFRGKGSRDGNEIMSGRDKIYFVYVYDLDTQQVQVKGVSSCKNHGIKPEFYDWCWSTATSNVVVDTSESNSQMVSIMESLHEWTVVDDRCNAFMSLVSVVVALLLTTPLQAKLQPEVWLSLMAMSQLMLIVSAGLLIPNGGPGPGVAVSLGAFIPGIMYLLVGSVLYRIVHAFTALRRQLYVKAWSLALLRVGTVFYTFGVATQTHGLEALLFTTVPLLVLYHFTQLRVCLVAALLSATRLVDNSSWLTFGCMLVGFAVGTFGFLRVNRQVLRVGVALYTVGAWGMLDESYNHRAENILLNLILVVIPNLSLAVVVNDSTAALLGLIGLVIQYFFLAASLLERFLSSLGEGCIIFGHVLVLAIAVLAILITCSALSEGCFSIHRPQRLPRILWSAIRGAVQRRLPQRRQQQVAPREQELSLMENQEQRSTDTPSSQRRHSQTTRQTQNPSTGRRTRRQTTAAYEAFLHG